MPADSVAVNWRSCADAAALAHMATDHVASLARANIAERGRFQVALAGGNTPRRLYERLRDLDTDWSAWHIYFGDERCVPAGDERRNDVMARAAWLDHVAIGKIHPMPAERGPASAAQDYARLLASNDKLDLCVLGMGEDGHTASLFPGHDLGAAGDAPPVLAVLDAPKPPPERVTLSLRTLNASRHLLVLIDGQGKRNAVARWRAGADLPVSRLAPRVSLTVMVTRAAMPGE